MGKSVTINTEKLEAFINNVKLWLNNFFKTIDTYEMIALGAIGLGVVLIIVGLILL